VPQQLFLISAHQQPSVISSSLGAMGPQLKMVCIWLLLAAQASAWLASQLHNNLFLGPWIAWFNMFLFIPQMVALGGTSVDLQARLSQLSDVIHAPQLASWQQAVPYLDQLLKIA
jgi:hypothetical protein